MPVTAESFTAIPQSFVPGGDFNAEIIRRAGIGGTKLTGVQAVSPNGGPTFRLLRPETDRDFADDLLAAGFARSDRAYLEVALRNISTVMSRVWRRWG